MSHRSNLLIADIEPNIIFPASADLRFPWGAPFGELPLIPTLRNLTADFERIINAFEMLD